MVHFHFRCPHVWSSQLCAAICPVMVHPHSVTCPHLHFKLHSGLPPQGFISHEPQDFLPYQNISRANSQQGISQLELCMNFIRKLQCTSKSRYCCKCTAKWCPGSSPQPVSTQGTATLQRRQVCACDCLLHLASQLNTACIAQLLYAEEATTDRDFSFLCVVGYLSAGNVIWSPNQCKNFLLFLSIPTFSWKGGAEGQPMWRNCWKFL